VSGLATTPLGLFSLVWPQNRWRRFLAVWPQNLLRRFSLVWPQNQWRRISPVWPQNWWLRFSPVWPQNWWRWFFPVWPQYRRSVSWLSLKTKVVEGFPVWASKPATLVWPSKSPQRFLGLGLKTKQVSVCRLCHKTDGGRLAWDTC
jgi:hypothetical protein